MTWKNNCVTEIPTRRGSDRVRHSRPAGQGSLAGFSFESTDYRPETLTARDVCNQVRPVEEQSMRRPKSVAVASLALLSTLFAAPAMRGQSRPYTPDKGSAERKAISDALRVPIEKRLRQEEFSRSIT